MPTIRKRGAKWQVQIRRVGSGAISRSFHIRRDAELWSRQMESEADRCELPKDPRTLQRVTLGELVERYRDTVTLRKRGYDVERIVLNAFLRHPICRKALSEIGPKDFAAYRDERLKAIKGSTLRRQLAPLHNMFEVAREEWGLPLRQNPLSKVRVPLAHQKRERRLRNGELDKLVVAARSCRYQLRLPIVLFALATGMRRGEILALRWEHIDREAHSFVIAISKNGYARILPLSSEAERILDTVLTDSEQVFPVTLNSFRLGWQRLRDRAKLGDLRFHDLRHEAISRFFEKGLSVPEVALLSGHRDARMLFRYTHPAREEIIRKLDRRC